MKYPGMIIHFIGILIAGLITCNAFINLIFPEWLDEQNNIERIRE